MQPSSSTSAYLASSSKHGTLMPRDIGARDLTPVLSAADNWMAACLIDDGSIFSDERLWSAQTIDEVHKAFVEHPDFGADSFITKLKGQMRQSWPTAQRLLAEMLWALLLFPSNMKAATKRKQVREMWSLSGSQLPDDMPALSDSVLQGIGSGGPGFNTYRPDELAFLIAVTRDLKLRPATDRRHILTNYDAFMTWMNAVPRDGSRQFRHMLRYFAFPDHVERMSSNNDRCAILVGFGVAPPREVKGWKDRQLDDALAKLRRDAGITLDFYAPGVREKWTRDRTVKTPAGEVTVVVPTERDEEPVEAAAASDAKPVDARQSLQMQAKLAEIGIAMGFSIWLPRGDRGRVRELMVKCDEQAMLDDLPLNYDTATLDTIEQIDVLWLKRRSIVRAFEVEHSTAVYSGLLRMADLLALQPNMDIRLHIVAPDERREKVFREMRRPVFSLLDRGPLSQSCSFISYESVETIRRLEHLAYTTDKIIGEYEQNADA